jgi:predicted Zn-dependent protease
LTVDEAAVFALLCERAPQLAGGSRLSAAALTRIALWAGGTAALVAGLVLGWPRLADGLAQLLPPAWEERLGQALVPELIDAFAEMESQPPAVCTDAPGRAALDRLTRRLAAPLDTPYRITVTVAAGKTVNAFAAPGGQVVLFEGLLTFSQSADELAGVLAHEMAHVAARHPTRRVIRDLGFRHLIDALTGGTLATGWLNGLGEALVSSSFSRQDERDADAAAAATLRAAGIRGDGLGRFLVRLRQRHGEMPEILSFLSTHPPAGERQAALEAQDLTGDRGLSDEQWEALRSMCSEREMQ